MSHPDVQTIVFEIVGEMPKDAVDLMNEIQDATANYISVEAERLGISEGAMADIFYLRTRSRWTQEKEDYLIHLALSGQTFPSILSGEF